MCKSKRGSNDPDLSKKNFMEVLDGCTEMSHESKYWRLRRARQNGNGRITNELLKQFYDRAKAEHDAMQDQKRAEHRKKQEVIEKQYAEMIKKQEAKDEGADLRYTPFKATSKPASLNSAYDKAAARTECSESHAV